MEGKKRFAPLINLLYGIVGIGEGIGRLSLGDAEGATNSFIASIAHVGACAYPYMIEKGNRINGMSGILNLTAGIVLYTAQIISLKSTSITYTLSPIVHMLQVGTNSWEAYVSKRGNKVDKQELTA